jgi:hypothetical protein
LKPSVVTLLFSLALGFMCSPAALGQSALPRPDQPFQGKIGKSFADSQQGSSGNFVATEFEV